MWTLGMYRSQFFTGYWPYGRFMYVISSANNIFIYYSVQYFTLKKLNLLGLIILPDLDNAG